VALATVRTEGLDEAGLERVRREAQAMARLGDHPHVVTVFDIGEEDGRPFIVSQYMPGGSVDDLLAQAPEHRLPVVEAVRIAAEICQALEHAHALGIVHRDIKPANVWLTEGGSTRLGDFGLAAVAAATSRSRLTKEGMMVGTVAYMAPEQALGSAVDTRADLYSLGALLYELLTGRPPFLGADALTVISQQINTPPMAPWWHNPGVPKELGTLVLELLAKNPEDRPASAAEVHQRLLETQSVSSAGDADSAPETPAPADTRRTARLNRLSRFVGRADELRDLKRAVEGALQGRGGLVMVSGEPGIGKTRLADEVGVYARLGGAQVLTGRCYEAESSVPYMPFVEAMRAYVATRPPDELRQELGGAASDVAKLVSDIRDRIPDLPSAPRHEGEEERYRLFEGVASFLVNAAGSTPVILVLDDLHWADAPSLRLLQHLARRLTDSRLLVIGTYRDVELSRRHPLTQTLAELRREHAYQRIGLQGLSRAEVREFLAGITEREVEPAEEALVDAFYRATEGNPYFLEEMARHLLETGGAYWESGRWQVNLASVDSGIIPEGIRELIGRRLSTLSDACNDVLTRAAVLGPQFDFAVLERVTGLEEEPLLEALEEALRAQLIEQSGAAHGQAIYTFTHAVVRQSLYDELSLPRRQRLHRRAGEAIETVYAHNLTSHLPALALHFRQAGGAGDPHKAIEYCVRAGGAARAIYAYEDAVRHWEAAVELMEDGAGDAETQAGLLARLGDLLFVTGLDHDGSIRNLEKALRLYEELDQSDHVAQMHSRLGRGLSSYPDSTMDIPRALSHYRAAEAIGSQIPEGIALGYVWYGMAVTADWGLWTDDGLAAAERAMDLAIRLGNDRLRRHAATQHGLHLLAGGRLAQGFAELEATWHEADAANDVTVAFASTWIAGGFAVDVGHPTVAKAGIDRELGKPRLAEAPTPRRILGDHLGRAHAVCGELADARRLAEVGTKYTAPLLAFLEGRFDEAARIWTAQREQERRSGNRHDEWRALHGLAVLRGVEGNTAEAEALHVEALAIAVDGGHQIFELRTRAELVLLLVDADRSLDTTPHLARCRAILGEGEDWRGLAGRAALAESAVAASDDRLDEAEDQFSGAVEIARRYTLPWDEAEALHRWGLARLKAGDHTGALEKLAGALEIYRRHGAGARWVERVLADKLLAQGIDPTMTGASIDLVAAAALDERPDLVSHAAPDGTVTLLFSDIEGSTALNERLGDGRFLDVLHAHNQIVREQVSAHGGFEVKSQGDGFMVAFSSARRGLECAIGIQRSLRELSEKQPEQAVAVRIGLHTGEVVKEGDDFFGRHVALAARVAGAATGGEILVSSLVKELADTGDINFGPPRDVDLKGISGLRRLHDVLWA
jgi:class 3 adenylate cyclase